jgi:hypothetical protein
MRTKYRIGRKVSLFAALTLASLMTAGNSRAAEAKKPNIVVIMGDDIGM